MRNMLVKRTASKTDEFKKCTSDKNRLLARKVDGCCYDLDQTERELTYQNRYIWRRVLEVGIWPKHKS